MRESCQPVAKGCRNNVVEIKQAPRLASEESGLGMCTAVSQKDHGHMKSEEKSSVLQNLRCLTYQRTKECNQHGKHKENLHCPCPASVRIFPGKHIYSAVQSSAPLPTQEARSTSFCLVSLLETLVILTYLPVSGYIFFAVGLLVSTSGSFSHHDVEGTLGRMYLTLASPSILR
jgi:hypothetical protein